MIVGVCRVVLALPGNNSLKGKRSVVKSVLERARQRYHVAAAEIEDLDNHRRAALGFAYVSNDAKHARSVLDKLVGFIATSAEVPLLEQSVRVERLALGTAGLLPGADLSDGAPDASDWDDDDDVGVFEDKDGDDEEG